jgi:hypothetical protein
MKLLLIGLLTLGSFSALANVQESYSEIKVLVKKGMQWTWVDQAEIDKSLSEVKEKAKVKCEIAEAGDCSEVFTRIVRILTSEDQGYLTTKVSVKSEFKPSAR